MGYSICDLDAICEGCGAREPLAADTFDQISDIWAWNRMLRSFGWFLEILDPPSINRMLCPVCKEKMMTEQQLPLSQHVQRLEGILEAAKDGEQQLAEIEEYRAKLQDELGVLDEKEQHVKHAMASADAARTVLVAIEALLDPAQSPAPAEPQGEPVAVQLAQEAQQEPPAKKPVDPLARFEWAVELVAANPWQPAASLAQLSEFNRGKVDKALSMLAIGGRLIRIVDEDEGRYIYAIPGTPEPPKVEAPQPEVAPAPQQPEQSVTDKGPAQSASVRKPEPAPMAKVFVNPPPAHLRENSGNAKPDGLLVDQVVGLARELGRAMSETFFIGRLTKGGKYKSAEITSALCQAVESGLLSVSAGDKYGCPS